jgi:hypothetical protein
MYISIVDHGPTPLGFMPNLTVLDSLSFFPMLHKIAKEGWDCWSSVARGDVLTTANIVRQTGCDTLLDALPFGQQTGSR